MSAEKRLIILEQVEYINEKQIEITKKSIALAKTLSKDLDNETVAKELELLQIENSKLQKQSITLLNQY